MSASTKTLCPYCGVGCGLELSPPAIAGKATNRDAEGKSRLAGTGRSPASLKQRTGVCEGGPLLPKPLIKIGCSIR